MRLYRVEHVTTENGMWTWRDAESKLVLEHLTDTRLLEMPMPHDPAFRLHGDVWKTAVDNMADMSHWFTVQDVEEMAKHGFRMLSFNVADAWTQKQEFQVLFSFAFRYNVKDITAEWLAEMKK